MSSLELSTSVLYFTEYKATQSLLMSSWIAEFGIDTVTFINGDGKAKEILHSHGQKRTIQVRREDAATRFNNGAIRFLVSTEAAGEGIDLQGHCHTLNHPWVRKGSEKVRKGVRMIYLIPGAVFVRFFGRIHPTTIFSSQLSGYKNGRYRT